MYNNSRKSFAMIEKFQCYNYTWTWNDEDIITNDGEVRKQCIIRIYGFNEKNETVYIKISDFDIPVFIELPPGISENAISSIIERLQSFGDKCKPSIVCYEERHKFYFAYVDKLKPKERKKDENGNEIKYVPKSFPYLMATFPTFEGSNIFASILNKAPINVPRLGQIKLKCHGFERNITPVIKLIAFKQLPSAGWMIGKGEKITGEDKESTKMHEYHVSYNNLMKMKEDAAMLMPIVYPKILSFDCEANSSLILSMPNAKNPKDVIFQIGVTILDPIKDKKKNYRKYLIAMGKYNPIKDVTIINCKTEADVICGLSELIKKEDPDVLLGFNILGWDMPYMIERSKDQCYCFDEFRDTGCIRNILSEETEIDWKSSAYGKTKLIYLETQGRIFIDMLPYIKRNYKLPNYRLETCLQEIGPKGIAKDPVKPKDIFKSWRMWYSWKKNPVSDTKLELAKTALTIVGEYCCQDSYATLLLYEKLLTWFDLTESGNTNNVPMFDMYTRGQQVKIYSQVYQYGIHNNIVIESNGYTATENEHYTGAYVSEPIKGLYMNIVPFDFASLYPSIMRAYNIDPSKLVNDHSIPDEDCEVMEWSEHHYCGCPLDEFPGKKPPKNAKDGTLKRVCADFKYRWLKKEVSGKGVFPTLLEKLINARKSTRKIIANNVAEIKCLNKILEGEKMTQEQEDAWKDRLKRYKEGKENVQCIELILKGIINREEINSRIEYLEDLNLVLDRRQNAYKVNANSMYGAMGVKKGMLPFLPGAMCVTFMGRTNIRKANKFIEENYGGKVIYNDTDSAYCHFPLFNDKPVSELWTHAIKIAKEIKGIFPPPLSLEFEEKIYRKFLILTKKRYVAQPINEEGKLEDKLIKRGIILQRRDNCRVLRDVYQNLIMGIFNHHEELLEFNNRCKIYKDRIAELKKDLDKSLKDSLGGLALSDALYNKLINKENETVPRRRVTGTRTGVRSKAGGKKKIKSDEEIYSFKSNHIGYILDEDSIRLIRLIRKERSELKKLVHSSDIVTELLNNIIFSVDTMFEKKYGVRDFVITKQMTKDANEYKNPNKLPSHVLLGEKMKRRGVPIAAGSRIEYLIVEDGLQYKKTESQKDKIIDIDYFIEYREIFRVSYLDYLKQFINPIDEICDRILNVENFIKTHLEDRIQKSRLINELKDLTRPREEFIL